MSQKPPSLGLTLSVALVLGSLAGATAAGVATADTDPDLIGEVRQDTLFVTLEKITAAALQHNEQLAASGAMAEGAGAEALGAWRGFLPRLDLGGFYNRTDDPLGNFAYKLNLRNVAAEDFFPERLNDPGTNDLFTARLRLRQPIFNGGISFNGKQAANAFGRAADLAHQRAKETVDFQAAQAYHGLVLATALEQVVLSAIESATGNLRQAQALLDAEMATEADLLQAKVHLHRLEQQRIEIRNRIALAGENIKLLTAVDTRLPLAPAAMTEAPDLADYPDGLDIDAVAGRSDLQGSRFRSEAAGKLVGVARGAMLPHLNLSAERYLFGERFLADDAHSWNLGIFATWDLFSGLENLGKLKKARADHRAAEYLYQFHRRQAQVEATEAYLTARAAAERVALATEAVRAAKESLRIVQNQYREGLASMVDLLETQAAATATEGDLVTAIHDYHLGLARLRYSGALGRPEQE